MIAGTLLLVQGKEYQEHPEGVGVEDGRRVEGESAAQQFHEMPPPYLSIQLIVLSIEGHTGQEVDHVCQQQIEHHGHDRPQA